MTPRAIVVMGVAGAGKSTIGALLASRLGWTFRDADSFHPPANVEKMRSGTPLTDDDRAPWLAAIAAHLDAAAAADAPTVVTCSALKRSYRSVLRDGRPHVALVHLTGHRDLIAERMAARPGHFMPAALLDSQFATLEPPGIDENAIEVDVTEPPEMLVDAIIRAVRV